MSDDEPPAKRRRTGDTQDDPPKKSETYWFEDGNIVLKASGATSGETLYRVHSSIFARHSEVFKDMLSIPQPSKKAEAEMIDGCPIISLTDAKYDIENMISIFYDNKIDEFRGQLRVLMVESMLRLGNKYAITHLEEEALFRLHHDYPQDLVSWDAMMNELVQPLIETDHHVITWIIKIAHEFDLNTILPAAYSAYIKAVESMDEIPSAMFLPQKAKERCLIGYAKMLEYLKDKNVGTLCPPLFLPAKSCVGHCESKKFDVIKGLRIWETKSLGILDAGELTGVANLCSRCKVEVRKFRKQTREDFWALLPTFYGLPPWENLKDG